MPEISEKEWRNVLQEAIDFVQDTVWGLDTFSGKIIEEDLTAEERNKVKEFKRILGDEVLDYLGFIETSRSFSGGVSPPLATVKKEERLIKEEFARIRLMSRQEVEQNARKYR